MKEEITAKKNRYGYYDFYYGGKNITYEWMWFFSGLPSEKEKDCVKLFTRQYKGWGKKLKKDY